VAGVVLVLIFGGPILTSGLNNKQMEEAITALTKGNSFLIFNMIIGSLTTVLGGYIAGRVAKREIYLNSGVIGLVGIAFGIMFGDHYPTWYNLAAFITVVPLALAGGYLAKPKQLNA
jgi:predicted membrane channel-forming protein YqfA (hemolysin III family)